MPSWLSSLQRRLHPPGAVQPRYTLAKFTAFLEYSQQTRRWRHIVVLLVAPLPSLAIALLAPLVPLQDPRLGVRANRGYFINCLVTIAVVVLSSIFQIRATARVSTSDFPLKDVALISALTSGLCALATFGMAALWRFPVPFSIAALLGPYFISLFVAHALVLRGRLWSRDSVLRGPILAIMPSFAVMASQIIAYPALSSVFASASELGQIAMIVVFPVIKYSYRVLMRRLMRHLPEDGNESAVSGVEIAAVMYQSTLMQNTPSPYATALLIGMDIAALFIGIFVFMARPSSVAPDEIINRAAMLLQHNASGLLPLPPSVRIGPADPVASVAHDKSRRVHPLAPRRSRSDRSLKPIVAHALELLHKAESHVLIEFYEIAQPAVNALFICLAAQLQSAEYNPKLRVYRHRPQELHTALANLAMYTALQAASFVIMHAVVWWRYRLSTTTLLAFLLERHAWATQGKLITWIALMFQLPVLHYGFDFTFQFNASLPPLD